MPVSVTPIRLANAITDQVRRRLKDSRVEQVLVSQAKRRIDQGGDSTVVYPSLWADQVDSYRSGGQPLKDIGELYNGLSAEKEVGHDSIKLRLVSPHAYAKAHQEGFSTKGPNFIPLTRKAVRNYSIFRRLMRARSFVTKEYRRLRKAGRSGRLTMHLIRRQRELDRQLEAAGFIEGETYIMAWQGVTVPARPIFNMPPENVEELVDEIAATIGGKANG
jgi:phage gpG-like protein